MKTQYITRVGWCDKCYANLRPQTGQLVLYAGSQSGFYVKEADVPKNPIHPIGFTPHLYTRIKTVDDIVTVKKVCCMNGCDVVIELTQNNKYHFYVLDSKWQTTEMSKADWNALLKYKRDINYII